MFELTITHYFCTPSQRCFRILLGGVKINHLLDLVVVQTREQLSNILWERVICGSKSSLVDKDGAFIGIADHEKRPLSVAV